MDEDMYEWGIDQTSWPLEEDGPHRDGMTEQEARSWIEQAEAGGIKPGSFTLIRRPIAQWERVS